MITWQRLRQSEANTCRCIISQDGRYSEGAGRSRERIIFIFMKNKVFVRYSERDV